jgi:hypothetical protein
VPGAQDARRNLIVQCYNCSKLGLFAKDCTSEVVCRNCGRTGHIARDCPSPAKPQGRFQTSVATLRRRKTEQRFANGTRINGIDCMQLTDRIAPLIDLEEYEVDEQEISGIPEGFDQGMCAVKSEAENIDRPSDSDSEENSDETELINALSKFMTKQNLIRKGKQEKGTKLARHTNEKPFLTVIGWIFPISWHAWMVIGANGVLILGHQLILFLQGS